LESEVKILDYILMILMESEEMIGQSFDVKQSTLILNLKLHEVRNHLRSLFWVVIYHLIVVISLVVVLLILEVLSQILVTVSEAAVLSILAKAYAVTRLRGICTFLKELTLNGFII
jgi:hypothetical protein